MPLSGEGKEDDKYERVRLIVSGRVQGVFFRAFAKEQARALDLKGWVRNMPDGSVELLLEGEGKAVGEMIEWCRKGPAHARVQDVKIEPESFIGEFPSFDVRY